MDKQVKYYYFANPFYGLDFALFRDYKPSTKTTGKWKYLGFTTDSGWPKKLNTGRLIQKPTSKAFKKCRERLKKYNKKFP